MGSPKTKQERKKGGRGRDAAQGSTRIRVGDGPQGQRSAGKGQAIYIYMYVCTKPPGTFAPRHLGACRLCTYAQGTQTPRHDYNRISRIE